MSEEQIIENEIVVDDVEEEIADAEPTTEDVIAVDGEVAPAKTPPPRLQKRIDKIVSEREQAKQEAEYWKQEALKAANITPRQAPPPAQEDLPPVYQEFNTEEEYIKAQEKYLTNKIKKEVLSEVVYQQKAKQETESVQSFLQEFYNKSDDHAALVESYSSENITPEYIEKLKMLAELDNGQDVLYDLMEDEKRYAEYFRAPMHKAALFLGRFSEQKKINSKLLPSKKLPPKPLTTVSGSGAKTSVDLNKLSIEQLQEYRKKHGYQ